MKWKEKRKRDYKSFIYIYEENVKETEGMEGIVNLIVSFILFPSNIKRIMRENIFFNKLLLIISHLTLIY